MFEDVAVPYVAAGAACEGHDNPRDHTRIGANSVLPAGFIWFGTVPGPEVQLALGLVTTRARSFAGLDLEAHQVQMNGMGIVGGIDEGPDFRRSQHRFFSVTGMLQWEAFVKQLDWIARLVDVLVERQQSGLHGLRFGDPALDAEWKAASLCQVPSLRRRGIASRRKRRS